MVPDDVRRQIQAADQAAAERRHAAIAAHQQALERHDRSATPETAADVERTRAAAHAAHEEYTHDGRHVTGRHDAAMLRWAASITAQRPSAEPSAGEADSARVQANRAAVAANEAYRAGDLDQARQLTGQAAALDPSRAELWQQHRQQIDARQLILDAKAAHADGDHQRAGTLLGQARQLDPRMPALWDGNLPAPRAAQHNRQARDRDVTAHGLGPTTGSARSPARDAGREHHAPPATALADQEPPQPSWPSSPAHGEPHQPSADTAQDAFGTRPSAQRHVAAAPREPRAHRGIAADDPDAPADPADSGPAARWPAPNPAIAEHTSPAGQQAGHEATARQEPEGQQHSGAVAEAEPGTANPERPAAAAADWRDQVLREARQPWQPGPAWPHHPAIERTPQADTPGAGIEPGR